MSLVPMLLYAAGMVVRSVREHYIDCCVIMLGRFLKLRPVAILSRPFPLSVCGSQPQELRANWVLLATTLENAF